MKMIDLHCDTIIKLLFNKEKGMLLKNDFHVDINKLEEANSFVQFFAIFAHPNFCLKDGVNATNQHELVIEMHERFLEELEYSKNKIGLVRNFEDIALNENNNTLSALLTIEGADSINGKIERIQEYYDMGIRLITLTWNFVNSLGYPNLPSENMNKGLTDFGIKAIKKMNELGIIIDVSHLSDGGFWDVVKYSSKPFVASHSNSRHLSPHHRNLTDEMILAIANAKGVIGINYCPAFLTDDLESKEMTILDLVKHINYIKKVGGIDCISLGSDFDGISGKLEIENVGQSEKLLNVLKSHGYTREEIAKIWYKNALRVMENVLN